MWLWFVAAFVAYFIKGLCGFANTLVFTSILGFTTDNVLISPVELMLTYPSNFIMILKNRKSLRVKVWLPLSILVLLGCIPGAIFLRNVDARYIKIIFGVAVVLIGIEMLLRELNKLRTKDSKWVLGLIGLLSGVLCGMYGIGALLAAYVGRVTDTSDEFKANINAVFIAENTFRLILYVSIGILTLDSFKTALILLPVMLIGLFAGMFCSKFLGDKVIKRIVIVLLIISGIVLVLKNLFI